MSTVSATMMHRLQRWRWTVAGSEAPGSSALELVQNVRPLAPESTVFRAMLEGWARQQRARFLQESGTIAPRLALIPRMADFTGRHPWQWIQVEAGAFIAHLRSGVRPIMVSTARGYEVSIQMFCAYISDRRYGWATECEQRFGLVPQQVFHEWNTVMHVAEYEGDSRRRPLHYDEVQALFDTADSRGNRSVPDESKGLCQPCGMRHSSK